LKGSNKRKDKLLGHFAALFWWHTKVGNHSAEVLNGGRKVACVTSTVDGLQTLRRNATLVYTRQVFSSLVYTDGPKDLLGKVESRWCETGKWDLVFGKVFSLLVYTDGPKDQRGKGESRWSETGKWDLVFGEVFSLLVYTDCPKDLRGKIESRWCETGKWDLVFGKVFSSLVYTDGPKDLRGKVESRWCETGKWDLVFGLWSVEIGGWSLNSWRRR
jgi:hypothetical protein